ncbi:MAG: PrsW family intramembrane metalloprotease [Caldilineales bacterium]|nr:PrsW family intramembrane metalloprotease [Caldilineales bacterium]
MTLALPLAFLAALLPTIIYVYLIWWCDQYEREPAWLLLVAFLWGAIPAILLSLGAEVVLGNAYDAFALGLQGSLRRVVIISPVVEELAKGLALLGLILFFSQEIDGVLDGIIYGALVGIGFAMTENFFFLNRAAQAGIQDLLTTALVRTLVFGLNHAYYAAIIGAAIGLAAWQTNSMKRALIILGGLASAMLVHALHNLTTILAAYYPLLTLFSVLLNWGGVALFVVIILLSIGEVRERMQLYLADEVPDVVSAHNYGFLLTCDLRWGRLTAWLAGKDARQARLEVQFQRTAAELVTEKRREELRGEEAEIELITLRQRLHALDQELGRAHC